jgi:hypothetical protein
MNAKKKGQYLHQAENNFRNGIFKDSIDFLDWMNLELEIHIRLTIFHGHPGLFLYSGGSLSSLK